jgi:UDP-N-acetylglucosamine--N-acetylmuramyl-(pentapeptide) pyrophosphoryl-undecaprenol N-acetylglucosamine transferase
MIDSPSYHRLKIILTGGGTAGHVWPLLEIAKALKSHQLLYLGSTGPEVKLVPQRGIEFKKILSGKWRRYFSFKNIIDLIKITFGVIETWWVVKSFQPDIILSKGGYVSLPVVLVARYLKIPLVIHESDIIMGVANRIAVNFAQKIFLGFPPENYQNLPWDKVIYTGIPVREDFRQSFSKKSNRPNIFRFYLPCSKKQP